jgi:DNA-binding response OmpR family regulator
MDEHQAALGEILHRSDWPAGTGTAGRLFVCSDLDECLSMLRRSQIPIVLCDTDSNWQRLLDEFRELPEPPCLILTSRLADDRLWSEALNLGAYDVLAKPFDRSEVVRVLTMAWMRWNARSTEPFRPVRRGVLTQYAYA